MTKILTAFGFLLVLSLFTVGVSSGLLQQAEAQRGSEADIQCRTGMVLVYHINFRKYICTSQSGAAQWVQYGIAEIIGAPTAFPEVERLEKSDFAKTSEEKTRVAELEKIFEKILAGEPISKSEERMAKRVQEFVSSQVTAEQFYGKAMEEKPMEKMMEDKPMDEETLPAIPAITKAGTIDDATLYDDGTTNTWDIVAVSQGDLLDFSEKSAQEKGLDAVYGVFNGSHIWITGHHETSVQGIKHHENVKDFQAHTHLVSLRNTSDCTYGFAYEKVHSTDTDNTSIVHDQMTDTSTIEYSGIPANSKVGDIVDKSLVCHMEDNGDDVGEYYVWEFYKGNHDALCIDFDTARSQDKLISQDAESGGFVCPE